MTENLRSMLEYWHFLINKRERVIKFILDH